MTAKWSLPLTRPIEIKGGPTLRTLDDARAFVLQQPETDQAWQNVAGHLIEAATSLDVANVSRQIESLLWHRGKWALPEIKK